MPEDLARMAAGMVSVAARKNGKRTLPLTAACDILEKNGEGVINAETGEVSMPHPSTIARAARRYGCHPDQLKQAAPARELRESVPESRVADGCVNLRHFLLPGGRGPGRWMRPNTTKTSPQICAR